MPKNYRETPKIRETIPSEKVQQAIKDLTNFLLKRFDFTNEETALVGIQTRGAVIAKRIADYIGKEKKTKVPFGVLDITLYRDDFSTSGISPVIGETQLDLEIDGKTIVLIDDVLFTGRTIRAALDEIMDFGRPKNIILAVLVDRGHRELPIQADYSAIQVATKKDETVNLHLQEMDGNDEIVICEALS